MAADPRTRPQVDEDYDDDMGDVHEETPYQTERSSRTGAWAHTLTPEWAHDHASARAQRRERNQLWASEL